MKWWHLALAMGAASGCATAPTPVTAIPAPASAPAVVEPDYAKMAFSQEFQPLEPAPAPSRPAQLFVVGSLEPGFSEKGGVLVEPTPAPVEQQPSAPAAGSRHRSNGRLIAQSGK